MATKRKSPPANWIASALDPAHKGALHRTLGVPTDKKIPAKKLEAAAEGEYGPKAQKRAVVARTLRKLGR